MFQAPSYTIPPETVDALRAKVEEGGPATIAAVDRDHPERREQAAGLPTVEVLDLADEAERAANRHDQHHRIEERDVVGGDDRRRSVRAQP